MNHLSFQTLNIAVDGIEVDSILANKLSEELAQVILSDPMLIAWFDGIKGQEHPEVPECQHKPGWLAYAEGHGGQLRVNVNNDQFSFIYTDAQTTSIIS